MMRPTVSLAHVRPTYGDRTESSGISTRSSSAHVDAGIHAILEAAKLDTGARGSDAWNPLGEWITPGSRTFVLPNFVRHRKADESLVSFQAACTQAEVLRPILDLVIRAADGGPIGVGNAPLQSASYERVIAETGTAALIEEYRKAGVDIGIHDLRQYASVWTRYGARVSEEFREGEDAVHFDLGRESALDPLFANGPAEVRVGDYRAEETLSFHSPGRHVYAVNRRILDADTIVSVPKLKTHQKVGITCALKGTVGTIARKECLAHHRLGGPRENGDEYPKSSRVHTAISAFVDRTASLGTSVPDNALRVAAKVLYRGMRLGRHNVVNGAWHGNDTAWRMVMDIMRIVRYGRPDGTLADTVQRNHIAFIDGIVGGEDDGPLRPRPVPAGILMFGTDPVWLDWACAAVMGFDARRLPMLTGAAHAEPQPLMDAAFDDVSWLVDGAPAAFDALTRMSAHRFVAPKGWRGTMEIASGA
jgi:uncharacterized protein (DUF362 family)